MSIRAIYENGVFKPLEDVPIKEGTEVDVCTPAARRRTAPNRNLSKSLVPTGCGKTATT